MQSVRAPHAFVSLCVLLGTVTVQAQDTLVEQFDGSFHNSDLNTSFRFQHIEGRQLGDTSPFTMAGATRFVDLVDGVLFFDGQARLTNDGEVGGSFGGVRRTLVDDSIFGAGVWFDMHQSPEDNTFQQMGASLEWFQDAWSFRANGYFPVGNTRQTKVGGVGGNSALRYQGNNIVFGTDMFRVDEVAMDGVELEVAHNLGTFDVEAFAGWYHFDSNSQSTDGFKVGTRGYLTDNLAASVTVSEDSQFGTNVFGGLTLFFGPGRARPTEFADKLRIPVERNHLVALHDETVRAGEQLTILTDPTSGQPIIVEHIDSTATSGGDGTFENPLAEINDLFANSADGATTNGNIAFVHSGSSFIEEAATLRNNQRFLGEGITHTVDSTELGTINLPDANGPGTVPLIAGSVDAVTLGSMGNEVSGFTIDNPTRAIVNDSGATDTNINRVTIQNTVGDGIVITPSTRTTITDVIFSNVGGQDIVLNASDTTLRNITSTNATGGSIFLQNLTGTTTLDNINVTGAGGTGGVLLDNAMAGSQTNLTNVDINGGMDGLSITGSQAGSNIMVTDLDVNGTSGTGVRVDGGDGDATFAGTTSVTNRGGTGIGVSNGAGNIMFDTATVTGTGGATNGIDIQNTTGMVSFNTANVSNSGGHGVFLNGVDVFSIGTNGMMAGDGGSITNSAGAGIAAVNSGLDIRFMNISGVTGASSRESDFAALLDDPSATEFGSGIAFGQLEVGTRTVVLQNNMINGTSNHGIYWYLLNGTVDGTVASNTVDAMGSGIEIAADEGSGNGMAVIRDNVLTADGDGIFGNLAFPQTLTITDFRNNQIMSGGSGIDLAREFVFDANPATSEFEVVEGGMLIIGSATNRARTGVEIFGDGALRFDSLQIFTEAVAPISQEDGIRVAFNDFDLTIGNGTAPSLIDILNAEIVSQNTSDNALEFVSEGGSLTLNDLNINMNNSNAAAIRLDSREATAVTLNGDHGNTTTNVINFKDVTNSGGGGYTGTIDFDDGTNTLP